MYNICTKCTPHHYENCPTCFGFGVRKQPSQDGLIPVRAGDFEAINELDWAVGPECNSTLAGLTSGSGWLCD